MKPPVIKNYSLDVLQRSSLERIQNAINQQSSLPWGVYCDSRKLPLGWQVGSKFLVKIISESIPQMVSAIVYDPVTKVIRLPLFNNEDLSMFFDEASVANLGEIAAWLDLFFGSYGWWEKQTASKIVAWNGLDAVEDCGAERLPYDRAMGFDFCTWNAWGGVVFENKKSSALNSPFQPRAIGIAGEFYQLPCIR